MHTMQKRFYIFQTLLNNIFYVFLLCVWLKTKYRCWYTQQKISLFAPVASHQTHHDITKTSLTHMFTLLLTHWCQEHVARAEKQRGLASKSSRYVAHERCDGQLDESFGGEQCPHGAVVLLQSLVFPLQWAEGGRAEVLQGAAGVYVVVEEVVGNDGHWKWLQLLMRLRKQMGLPTTVSRMLSKRNDRYTTTNTRILVSSIVFSCKDWLVPGVTIWFYPVNGKRDGGFDLRGAKWISSRNFTVRLISSLICVAHTWDFQL